MKNLKVWGLSLTILLCLVVGLTACGGNGDPADTTDTDATGTDTPTDAPTDAPTEAPTEPATEAPTETVALTEADTPTEEVTTEAVAEPETEDYSLHIPASKLDDTMTHLFSGNSVKNETVMFLDPGQAKSLLYKADEILSVTSYDGKITYVEGKDYELKDGQIVALEGTSIPCITSEVYYGADSSSLLMTKYNGKNVYTYWGEATAMTRWQVCVTYTHSDTWEGYTQETQTAVYQSLIQKLKDGEDVTVIFYGDSITFGANASFIVGCEPGQQSYPLLFVKALADLFDYRVQYVNTGLSGTSRVPSADYVPVEDYKGTITYINPSVGGWTSQNGVDNFNTYVKPQVEKYGCDLFIVAFGMNDAAVAPATTMQNMLKIMKNVEALAPESLYMVVSTMVPNPNATNGWYGYQEKQETVLLKKTLMDGKCAVACVTSVSKAVLEHKEFMDYTGNNINHPNDFFSRVYVQTLFQTFIGYENLD